jgi:hypothetical protein
MKCVALDSKSPRITPSQQGMAYDPQSGFHPMIVANRPETEAK